MTVIGGFLGVIVKYSQQMFPNTDHSNLGNCSI